LFAALPICLVQDKTTGFIFAHFDHLLEMSETDTIVGLLVCVGEYDTADELHLHESEKYEKAVQ